MNISNTDDTVNSREVEKRIEEMLDELKDAYAAYCRDDVKDDERPTSFDAWMDNEAQDKMSDAYDYQKLVEFADQGRGYGDWSHGATLIHESHFRKYAEQLADDTGAVQSESTWPNNCIDWDQAARELQVDYTAIEWDGETYYMGS